MVSNDLNPANRGSCLTTIFDRKDQFRDHLIEQIENRVIADASNEYIGPGHCLSFVNTLIQTLINEEDRLNRQRQSYGKIALETERKIDDFFERFRRDIQPGNKFFLREHNRILHLEEMSRYVRMMLRQAVYAASSQLLNEVIGMLEQLRTRIEHYQETLHIWNNEFEGYFEEKKTLLLQSE